MVEQDQSSDASVQGYIEDSGLVSLAELDVLVFLFRHQSSLPSAEQIARLLGHPSDAVGTAIENLEGHKLVLKSRRSQGSFLLIFFRNTAGLQQSLRQSIRLADHRSEMRESSLVKTGVSGLDDIFLGGIAESNVIMVQGAAGTGKTLLGLEFIYRGITLYNEPGIIVVFEGTPNKLVRDATSFGWNLAELEAQNKLKIVFTTPQVLELELRSPNSLLLEAAAEIGAQQAKTAATVTGRAQSRKLDRHVLARSGHPARFPCHFGNGGFFGRHLDRTNT